MENDDHSWVIAEELRAEIERLTAENAAIRKDRDDLLQQALGVEAERDIARMENERLRAALEPLAKYADNFDAHEYGDQTRPKLFPDHHHTAGTNGPTIGELRAARDLICQQNAVSNEIDTGQAVGNEFPNNEQ